MNPIESHCHIGKSAAKSTQTPLYLMCVADVHIAKAGCAEGSTLDESKTSLHLGDILETCSNHGPILVEQFRTV